MRVQQQAANNQLPQPLYEPRSTHTPTRKQTVGDSVEHQSCGGHGTGETPSNIPNLEAKPGSADGTATDRLWESRTPPQHTLSRRASSKRMGSFAYQAQPFLAGRARSSEESQRCGTMGLVSDTISLGLHSYTRTIHAASLTAPALAHCIGVHTRIGNEHADRLLTYPHVRFLSGCVLVPGPGDPPNSQFFAILHL